MRKLKIHILIVSIFSLSISCAQETEIGTILPGRNSVDKVEVAETFKNPLLEQGADPWTIRKGDSYYYTHTTGRDLRLWEIPNMEDLKTVEPLTIWTPPEGREYSRHIWAPEIHFLDGKWYMYFAATYNDGGKDSEDENRRMFVLENDGPSPMNTKWEIKGKVTDVTDKWAIDGTILTVNGENYFIWSGWKTRDRASNTGRQQLYIAKMKNPWTLEGTRIMISEPHYDWEKNGLVNEGPVTWKNPEGEIFLFYSASGCWTDDYTIGVLKLKQDSDPLDPDSWQKHKTPLFKKSEANSVYGTGHNSFFKSPDGTEDWILYHGNDNPGEGCGGKRKPRMQKISWDENGFPVLGVPVARDIALDRPGQNN